MLDRCYLTESVPVQLIWGEHDSVIPVSHGQLAHAAMPGSRLEIFADSGHFPFHDDPDRFRRDRPKIHRFNTPRRVRPRQAANDAACRNQRGHDLRTARHPGSGA